MLPKTSRLPGREFRSSRYRTVATPYFSLKVASGREGGARIGVVAGVNVHKSAAKRNFWKRQTKSAFSPLLKKNTGKDFLIILHPKVNTLSKKQFKEILLETAERSAAGARQ